nr:hypothetical protein CFP56_61409 [Quercus suber]
MILQLALAWSRQKPTLRPKEAPVTVTTFPSRSPHSSNANAAISVTLLVLTSYQSSPNFAPLHLISAVAANKACRAAVGAVASLKHRRWRRSRPLSVTVGADRDLKLRHWRLCDLKHRRWHRL